MDKAIFTIKGVDYEYKEITIECKPISYPNGITCISYDENGNTIKEVISHEEWTKRYNTKLK